MNRLKGITVKLASLLLLVFIGNGLQAAPHHPAKFLKSIEGKADAGQKIYEHYCALCHAAEPQIPLGAPRYAHPEDWQHRNVDDINGLLKRTDEGIGAMPPRGGCFECSDKQLLLAIKFMTNWCRQ